MPLIPQTERNLSIVDRALEQSGFVDPTDSSDVQENAKSILDQSGADLRSVLGNMTNLMNFAENEAVRLKAVENCLNIHGVDIKGKPESQHNTAVIINFKDVNEGKQRLDSVLCPVR